MNGSNTATQDLIDQLTREEAEADGEAQAGERVARQASIRHLEALERAHVLEAEMARSCVQDLMAAARLRQSPPASSPRPAQERLH